ncbi:sugar ABC transporter ATP-binding protein [Mesorhizobium sp. M0938]|uniref:sugar ABC transporter ATP-binding protein n=1 Tax=unclassified Mesorhizobium TaxID=325217 RepID=UPI00333A8B72
MAIDAPLLELTAISKRYGPSLALDQVDFDLFPGELHVLFGENGAGKSTLINVITGNVAPDNGRYRLAGEEISGMSPQGARQNGIAAVFQEFSLIPDLTVEENLFLGRERKHLGLLRKSEMRSEARALLADLGFDIPTGRMVAELSRAQRQMVEIAKALFEKSRILVLDEPTASLTDTDADTLFKLIAELKRGGVGIVYVSHRMREIRQLADRVTVLRGGKKVATVEGAGVTEAQLVEMMVGRPVGDLYPSIKHAPGKTLLEISGLSSADGRVRDVSLNVRAGEIVGLAGLVGCGKGEVGRLVFGLEAIAGGRITLGDGVSETPSPRKMLQRGVCYFPADRGTDGLAPNRPIKENASAAALDLLEIGGKGWLRKKTEARRVLQVLETLHVRPLMPDQNVAQFSGGNRQKVMLARGLMRDISVFLFDEPTVGIDVGAKGEIYELLRDLTEAGAAVLLASSELPEILNLSNRIYVMHEGEVVAELEGARRTEAEVLAGFFGKRPAEVVGIEARP